MTQNRRIVLNVLATYGRSAFAVIVGIFTSRWTLQALGVEAYGVYGVIGVVIGLVTMFNGMFSSAIGRFYAYAIGAQNSAVDKALALKECRSWFSVAVVIYTVLPILVLLCGISGGRWAVEHYFSIPDHLRPTAYWILYFSLFSVVIGLVTVPFSAMYTAKQYIAELTVYKVASSAIYLIFSYWLLTYEGNRLLMHAFFSMLMATVVPLVIAVRAYVIFPECRLVAHIWADKSKFLEIFGFTGWQVFGWLGWIAHKQGMTAIVNRQFGIAFNSTMSISNCINGHASTLGAAVTSAFTPAVTNAAGEGDRARFLRLTINNAKYGTSLCAVLMVPLFVEIHYVVNLWLKTPPPQVEGMCVLVMIASLVDRATHPFLSAIVASGNIKWHELANGLLLLLGLSLGYVFAKVIGLGIYGIGYASIITFVIVGVLRLVLWRFQLKQKINPWLHEFMLPFLLSVLLSCGVGLAITWLMEESFIRFIFNSGIVCFFYVGLSYRVLLNNDERLALGCRLKRIISKRR